MNINELKKLLEKSSDTLKEAVNIEIDFKQNEEENTMKKMNIAKKVCISATAAAASLVVLLNCIPSISYASRNIPVIGSIVRVVTFNRFEVSETGHEVKVVTPKIEGLLNKDLENKLNSEFKEYSDLLIAAIENDVKMLEKEYGKDFHLGVEASYIVRTDNEDYLCLDAYIVNTVASSSTKHSFYTIDKKNGALAKLDNLFKENADYVTPLSAYIAKEMIKQNESGTACFWVGDEADFEGFKEIKKNQNFFINDNGNIVICFDKYEVAIGAQGCPEFEIPNEVVKDILK